MRKLIYILLIPILVWSCNLDTNPPSEQKKNIQTEAELDRLLVGCYSSLHDVLYDEWALTEVRSDNARLRSTQSSTQESNTIREIDFHNVLSNNSHVENYWNAVFKAIYRSNDVLAHLHVASKENKALIEGQALFLRAYHYFNLVRLWGPMFIVDKIESALDYKELVRSPVDDVYAFIEQDLNKIIDQQMLPESYEERDGIGRATIIAAKTLLAKVYMTHYDVGSDKYLKAKTLLESVLAAVGNPRSGADLVPFDQIFDINNEMSKEIIFAVSYMSGSKGVGSPFTNLFGPSAAKFGAVMTGEGKSFNYPTTDIINAFKSENDPESEVNKDKRLDVTLREGFYDSRDIWINTDGNSRYVNKYMSVSPTAYDSENDWPVMRVGDVVLLYAEILNELGDIGEANVYLNMTRERAGLDVIMPASKYAFREALKKERRLELAFENHRLFDLIRWNDAVNTINAYMRVETSHHEKPKLFYYNDKETVLLAKATEYSLLLPIPLTVMNNVGPNVSQNLGY